jgi:hypothetical protein
MGIFLYVYGSGSYSIRVGFTGTRPLIYAIYATNVGDVLPIVYGQSHREITQDQYEWLRNHLNCDVSYVPSELVGTVCGLECRTHRQFYHLFSTEPFVSDLWDDRQV